MPDDYAVATSCSQLVDVLCQGIPSTAKYSVMSTRASSVHRLKPPPVALVNHRMYHSHPVGLRTVTLNASIGACHTKAIDTCVLSGLHS